MKNVVKSWKTTLIGVVIMAAAIYSVFEVNAAWIGASIPLAIGVLLMLAPDSLITTLKKLLSAKI